MGMRKLPSRRAENREKWRGRKEMHHWEMENKPWEMERERGNAVRGNGERRVGEEMTDSSERSRERKRKWQRNGEGGGYERVLWEEKGAGRLKLLGESATTLATGKPVAKASLNLAVSLQNQVRPLKSFATGI